MSQTGNTESKMNVEVMLSHYREHGIRATGSVVPKMSNYNNTFVVWKFAMEAYLVRHKLWPVVSGELRLEDVPEKKKALWFDMDQLAFVALLEGIKPELTSMLMKCGTSHEIWKKLEDHFQHVSSSNVSYYRTLYFTYKMKQNHTLAEHLQALQELEMQLAGMGVVVSDDERRTALLESLPRTYQSVTNMIYFNN